VCFTINGISPSSQKAARHGSGFRGVSCGVLARSKRGLIGQYLRDGDCFRLLELFQQWLDSTCSRAVLGHVILYIVTPIRRRFYSLL
jgi:hypothetical protein